MITHYYNARTLILTYFIKLLKGDAYLKSMVGTRIYTQHISTVENPGFPCITIVEAGGPTDPGIPEIGKVMLDLDIWSKKSRDEINRIYAGTDSNSRQVGIAVLLTNQGFDYKEVTIDLVRETMFRNDFFEPRALVYRGLIHYVVDFSAKKVTQ